MITRKAIVGAFEVMQEYAEAKTVVVFCPNRPNVSVFKMQRVRITRYGRTKTDFRVQLGRVNYAERQYIARQISKTHRTPKVWIIRKKGK